MLYIKLANMDPEVVSREIEDFIVVKTLQNHCTGAVLGASGGIDSSCVAIAAAKGYERYNRTAATPLGLYMYSIPTKENKLLETMTAESLAKTLPCTTFDILNLETEVKLRAIQFEARGITQSKFDKGNMISRMRATKLHDEAALNDSLVLGTGNRDEDFTLGYYTLFGDGAVHVSPIGALPKRLVKLMLNYYGHPKIADIEPTAGLELGQTDFRDLGYTYDFAEAVTEGILQEVSLDNMLRDAFPLAVESAERYKELYGKQKFNGLLAMIKDVKRRMKIADRKASLISPAICPVTLNYE
jgi:NAD+ synthase